MIPTFAGITFLVFMITRLVPGGPVERAIMEYQMQGGASLTLQTTNPLSDDQIVQLKTYYGLDKPLFPAYFEWLGKILRGDFGKSTLYTQPTLDLIKKKLPVSTFYGIALFIISYTISIPLGIYKALNHRKFGDTITSILVFVGYSLPGYVVGILLLSAFAYRFGWFPMGGFNSGATYYLMSPLQRVMDILHHAVLPLIAYAIGDFAVLTMTMKNNLLENFSADYVRTALAKGETHRRAVYRHAVRNSIIPIASHLGSLISVFLAGSFLIESVFNIDGMGRLGFTSIVEKDYPVVMAILAISCILALVGNILSDIVVAFVDPRIRFGKGA